MPHYIPERPHLTVRSWWWYHLFSTMISDHYEWVCKIWSGGGRIPVRCFFTKQSILIYCDIIMLFPISGSYDFLAVPTSSTLTVVCSMFSYRSKFYLLILLWFSIKSRKTQHDKGPSLPRAHIRGCIAFCMRAFVWVRYVGACDDVQYIKRTRSTECARCMSSFGNRKKKKNLLRRKIHSH